MVVGVVEPIGRLLLLVRVILVARLRDIMGLILAPSRHGRLRGGVLSALVEAPVAELAVRHTEVFHVVDVDHWELASYPG